MKKLSNTEFKKSVAYKKSVYIREYRKREDKQKID